VTASPVFDLTGTVALVAGGGGAIGSALASGLAASGAAVTVAGLTPERVADAAARIEKDGGRALAVAFDATVEADCQRVVDETVARFGRLDIVINAVGGGAGKVLFDAQDYPRDSWDWIMEINLRAPLLVTQAAVRHMVEAGHGGKVVNLLSVRAHLGINAGYSAYVASKGALASLTRQWATEWAKHGINVNGISPTFIDTPQVAMLLDDPAFKAGVVARVPLGRVGETGDLVGPTLFFSSPASDFVTGQILVVDGGLTATQ
jgi:gluconate 5-dehydrogenase